MPRKLAIIGPHEAALLEYDDAPLAANQVRIRTDFASGKHGTVLGMLDGGAVRGQRFDRDMRLFVEGDDWVPPPTPDKPHAIGTSFVGTISEIGESVTNWKVGEKVFGTSDIRETVTKPDDGLLWRLGDIDPMNALLVESAYVAFHCVRESNVRYGETVAVIGLGALGLLAVHMAVASGAEAVFAVDTIPMRREMAGKLGATAVFNPLEGDAALEIHQATGGKGVDVAIELSGAYPGLHLATRCVCVAGTVCSAGFYQGEAKGMWLGREWHHNRLTALVPHGCGFGHPPRDYPRWDERRAYDSIVSLMRQGKLSAPALINPLMAFENGPAAFQRVQNAPQEVLKFAVWFA